MNNTIFKTKRFWYISLFAILYLIVAFSSFFHAISFFALANVLWMSVILAFAFEIGQAAVLFSLLTSQKDRSRVMPWVLMTMFTLVQVIGNIYSSYKYIIQNSSENLRFFKEPIFIWTDIPDNQANVIIVYLVGALLPIASLLLTSMITNYLSDEENKKIEEENKKIEENSKELILTDENKEQEEIPTNEEEIEKTRNNDELVQDTQIPEEKIELDDKTTKEVEEIMNGDILKTPEKKESHFINLK